MILQVHDELFFEIHESEIEEVPRIIEREMEGAWKLRVPLRVDMGMGKNWAEMQRAQVAAYLSKLTKAAKS